MPVTIGADSSQSILLVEDDQQSQDLIKQILKPLKVIVNDVSDGHDAIQHVILHPGTNLILMDLKLPVLDGYEATKVIRKLKPHIPIIAQTAYAMAGDREKAISAGCDEYITKPIDSGNLLRLVKLYLSDYAPGS